MVKRDTYHHGDLKSALVEAAVEASRIDGPDAIVIRELAKQIGVTPPAAYRHFEDRQDLVVAVSFSVQRRLAERMLQETRSCKKHRDPQKAAVERFRAVLRGYLRFGEENPGWFRVVFQAGPRPNPDLDPDDEQSSGGQLTRALNDLVGAGLVSFEHREHAELMVWASIHGLTILRTAGPLMRLSQAETDASEALIAAGLLRALASS